MYGQSQKDINSKIANLQFSIGKLQAEYDWLDDNDPEKAKVKSMIQSKIYQKQYQEALKGQVDTILDDLQTKAYTNISDYLKECYDDGFIGTMFDLQGQGIPLCMPLDQEAMVRAVQLDSKISNGLYSRMGEDVSMLKKHITAQVSRGISSGMSFEQVAQQIQFKMTGTYDSPGGALARAMTIARTEGHRIQVQAGMDANYRAKEKGADVLKQWDSTMDSATRESHTKVDGEIRELDKPFSNGLMFPGDPSGGAAEVVNCRCALLQRARWALDKDELEVLKERASFFGLDKAETFEDYKKKYLKATKELTKTGNHGKMSAVTFDSFKLSGIDDDYVPDITDTFNGLMNDYPVKGLHVKTNNASSEFGHFQGGIKGTKKKGEQYAVVENEICISKTSYKDKATSTADHIRNYERRQSALKNADRVDLATIPHEYGHAIDHAYVLAKEPELKAFAEKYATAQKVSSFSDVDAINEFNRKVAKSNSRLSKEIFDELQKEYNLDYMGTIMRIDKEYGSYASSSISEFLAEAFANMRILPDSDKTEFMKSFEKIFNRKFNEVLGE